MQILPKQTKDTVDTLREQGRSAASGLRGTVLHGAAHIKALFDLFRLEIKEYQASQARRVLTIVVALVLLLFGYLLLCAFACMLLGQLVGLLWGTGIVCLVHFLVAGTMLALALNRKPGPLAPATRRELANDLQCLQILLKDKKGKS